jgi:hypothetical protein
VLVVVALTPEVVGEIDAFRSPPLVGLAIVGPTIVGPTVAGPGSDRAPFAGTRTRAAEFGRPRPGGRGALGTALRRTALFGTGR